MFDEVIEHHLDATPCVVTLWTKASVKSHWVRAAADDGANRNCPAPVSLDKALKLPPAFRRIQTADLSDWQGEEGHRGLARMLDAVDQLVDPDPERPPRPFVAPVTTKSNTRSKAIRWAWDGGWVSYVIR